MNPISDTAFYTCGIRVQDAQEAQPLCGDDFAHLFMTPHGNAIFDSLKADARPNQIIAVRHRMMDEFLRTRLAQQPKTKVILLGAGFDARAFRLSDGVWFEIDEPQVIGHKNHCLPESTCPNSLTRIAIDFSQETLASKLPLNEDGAPVILVMEGVFGYLSEDQIAQTLQALITAYPQHSLICDLMTKYFIETQGQELTDRIEKLGAKFQFFPDDPTDIFKRAGYRHVEGNSILSETLQILQQDFSLFLLKNFFSSIMRGYTMNLFEMTPRS
ncbi:MAG: SAM-dependent methyltransferase [Undibacterium sp.]|uniref:class I SAM-dependent methyltransferase n=1 Tax=Undibacterium sp. TaxID=1914977 RepID=UPI00271696F4|nr:SAM-dependent methyltransferase [Undibacterium sp.]MDO8650581.1 SAM-dependent methyltransferase [Undibacterium sp.]